MIKQPHSREIELGVLSCLILGLERNKWAIDELTDSMFYIHEYKTICGAIKNIHSSGQSVSYLAVKEHVAKNNKTKDFDRFVSDMNQEKGESIFDSSTYSYHLKGHIAILKDKERRRMLLSSAQKLVEVSQSNAEDINSGIGEVVSTLTDNSTSEEYDPSVEKAIADLDAQIKLYQENQKRYLGHESGFPEIDKKLDGLMDGHFGVVTGYTSAGKTAFALNIAASFIKRGQKVVFFSLEMSPSQLLTRLISIISLIPIHKVSKGLINDIERDKVNETIEIIKRSGMVIYESPDLDSIELTILKESADKNTKLFILDYLGLVQTKKQKDYEGLKYIAQRFQNIMKSFKVHLLALSQIDNAQIKDDNPFIISTKGSGDIGASADYVLRLKNKETDLDVINDMKENLVPLPIQLYIQKNRHGQTGVVSLYFHTQTTTFEDESTYNPDVYKMRLDRIYTSGTSNEFDI